MNNKVDAEVIGEFLLLCRIFECSEIWLDNDAIKAVEEKSPSATVYEYPMLLLYYPTLRGSMYYDKVNSGIRLTANDINDIKKITNDIWYAVDCRSDVKCFVSNERVEINPDTFSMLFSHFGLPQEKYINRDKFHAIAGMLWSELDIR